MYHVFIIICLLMDVSADFLLVANRAAIYKDTQVSVCRRGAILKQFLRVVAHRLKAVRRQLSDECGRDAGGHMMYVLFSSFFLLASWPHWGEEGAAATERYRLWDKESLQSQPWGVSVLWPLDSWLLRSTVTGTCGAGTFLQRCKELIHGRYERIFWAWQWCPGTGIA